MYYSDELTNQVRESNNIVDVIGTYVKLQKRGGSYVGLCPFHNEKTPSFSVSADKQLYHCFGCGAGGNIFTFLMEYENFSFREAMESLADRAGITLPKEPESSEAKKEQSRRQTLLDINRQAANYYYYKLRSAQGSFAMDYLTKRGLNEEALKRFGIGYSSKFRNELYKFLKSKDYRDEDLSDSGLIIFDEKNGAHDRFWNRIMFPIMDTSGKVIGFGGRVMGDAQPKYLNSPETYIFNKSRNLYGMNYARTARKSSIILCEGYMDVIAMHQAGFTNAVASLGTALTSQHASLLRRYTDDVRLAYDSDDAGQRAAQRAIPLLKSAGISVKVIDMTPYKDPDEFIKNLGQEEFQKRIDEAESGFMFEISLLAGNYRVSDPEERAGFVKEVAKRLLEFRDELERSIYIDSIASRYGIDSAGLTKMVNSFGLALSPEQIDEMNAGQDFAVREISGSGSRIMREDKQDQKIRLSQKMLLTYMIEDLSLFEKYSALISPDDFEDPLYHRAAQMAFEEYEKSGTVTPARIVASFEEISEQKEIAALFDTKISGGDDPVKREKIIADIVNNIVEYRKKRALKESVTMEDIMAAYNKIKK